MTTFDQKTTETITPRGTAAVSTGVARREFFVTRPSIGDDEDELSAGWNRHIDTIVGDWQPNLAGLDDGEFTPPSLKVIQVAFEIATGFLRKGAPPPDRVVMDGDGGISFERCRGNIMEMIEVYGTTEITAELIVMQDGKVVAREDFQLTGEL